MERGVGGGGGVRGAATEETRGPSSFTAFWSEDKVNRLSAHLILLMYLTETSPAEAEHLD